MLIDESIAKSVTNVSIAAGNEYKNLFRQTRCADVYVCYGTRAKCCWWRACPLLKLCNKCLPRSSARGAVRKNDMDATYYGRAGGVSAVLSCPNLQTKKREEEKKKEEEKRRRCSSVCCCSSLVVVYDNDNN